jgi:hypothetical protein
LPKSKETRALKPAVWELQEKQGTQDEKVQLEFEVTQVTALRQSMDETWKKSGQPRQSIRKLVKRLTMPAGGAYK